MFNANFNRISAVSWRGQILLLMTKQMRGPKQDS